MAKYKDGNKPVKNSENTAKGSKKRSFVLSLIPYVIAVVALFLLICFITNLFCNPDNTLTNPADHILGSFGYYVCNIFFGLFGVAAFIIPIIMALFVIFWNNYMRRSYVAINSVVAVAAAIVVSALLHTIVHAIDGNFTYVANDLFLEGAALAGGGVIGGLFSFGLQYVLNVFGTIFVLVAMLIPLVLFLCGTTPVEVAKEIVEIIKKATAEKREKAAEEKAHKKEQAKLDRQAEREQDKLDREIEREERRKERERARQEAITARAAEKEAQKRASEEAAQKAAAEKMQSRETKIILPNMESDGEDTPVLAVFSSDEKAHMDDIKNGDVKVVDGSIEDSDEVSDENDGESINLSTVVFVDPKDDGNKQRGHAPVDELFSERFDEGTVVDVNTGEVFTPVVQEKAPKSANEFRAQNEKKEQHFIGDKPEPAPIPEYKFPPVSLLEMGPSKFSSDPAEVEKNAELLREVLQDFRIPVREISCSCGPTITRYEVKPEAGVRVRQIAGLVDDISLGLAKSGVRIEAPIPGKAAVGIEVPNDKPSAVKLRNLIETSEFKEHKSKLAACLGADVSGNPVVFDIEKMPHVLVAGTTGSGKSVCINSIIMSILYHAKPDEVKLLLIDPKKVEFKVYRDIPHLCCRIISDPKKAAGALNSAVNEMEKRFELIEEVGVRNITGYNEATKNDPEKPYMPRLVIIIDEFADLMMTAKDEVETAVVRIAQKARAAGIHLIIGTQRPSVDVITGLIKANIPSRIAFTVMSGIDSRTILDTVGAEKLCGRGDMLYAPVGAAKPQRVQGAFVSDGEVESVVEYVKKNNHPVIYDQEFESNIDIEAAKCGNAPQGGSVGFEAVGGSGDDDALLFAAADLAVDSGKIATSMLQRRLSVGYGRAAKIIDRLEEMGVVGPPDGTKPRQVLMSREQLEDLKNSAGGDNAPF